MLEINTKYNVQRACHLHNDGTLNKISKAPALTATKYNIYMTNPKTAAQEEHYMDAPG